MDSARQLSPPYIVLPASFAEADSSRWTLRLAQPRDNQRRSIQEFSQVYSIVYMKPHLIKPNMPEEEPATVNGYSPINLRCPTTAGINSSTFTPPPRDWFLGTWHVTHSTLP